MKRIALAVLLLVSLAVPAHADFDEGLAAYKRGDYPTALREWRPLAEQGDAKAQFNLGGMYNLGRGVPQDYVEAVKWHRKAAEQGLAMAQYSLGAMYARGQGVPQDYAQAINWIRKAAEQGLAIAKTALAKMEAQLANQGARPGKPADFQKGNVAAQRGDFATALKEWKPLAEQGNVRAQYSLGLMYARGAGVPQNNKTAIKWYKLAAEQGFADAQYNLGMMYAMAQGTRWDNTRAHMWWNIAASQGHKSAKNNLDKVEKIMSATQLETAKKLAREWMEKHQK